MAIGAERQKNGRGEKCDFAAKESSLSSPIEWLHPNLQKVPAITKVGAVRATEKESLIGILALNYELRMRKILIATPVEKSYLKSV